MRQVRALGADDVFDYAEGAGELARKYGGKDEDKFDAVLDFLGGPLAHSAVGSAARVPRYPRFRPTPVPCFSPVPATRTRPTASPNAAAAAAAAPSKPRQPPVRGRRPT